MHESPAANQITLTSRLRYRAVGAEGVLVHLDSGRVIVVNEVGLFVIQQLSRPRTRQDLVQALVDEFNVTASQAESDLEYYLVELAAEQVLATPAAATGD